MFTIRTISSTVTASSPPQSPTQGRLRMGRCGAGNRTLQSAAAPGIDGQKRAETRFGAAIRTLANARTTVTRQRALSRCGRVWHTGTLVAAGLAGSRTDEEAGAWASVTNAAALARHGRRCWCGRRRRKSTSDLAADGVGRQTFPCPATAAARCLGRAIGCERVACPRVGVAVAVTCGTQRHIVHPPSDSHTFS